MDGIDASWIGVQSVIRVIRIVRGRNPKKQDQSQEVSYFISSLPPETDVEIIARGIRGHWSIENTLHHKKDVTFKEDSSRFVAGNAGLNKSILITIAINIFHASPYKNTAQAIRFVAHDIPKLVSMISA